MVFVSWQPWGFVAATDRKQKPEKLLERVPWIASWRAALPDLKKSYITWDIAAGTAKKSWDKAINLYWCRILPWKQASLVFDDSMKSIKHYINNSWISHKLKHHRNVSITITSLIFRVATRVPG